jgi:integrase/recombinase XerD
MPIDPNGLLAWERRYLTWMATKNYSAATVHSHDKSLRRFFEWCESRSLLRPEEITKPILEKYQRHLFLYRSSRGGKPLGFSTQHLHLVAVKQFFKYLTRQNVLLWNPASELELPKVGRSLPRQAFTLEEVERILGLPDVKEVLGLRDRAIMETFFATAVRRVELVDLTVFDFDESRKVMTIRHGKGDKGRTVPVGERAGAWIRKHLDEARPELAIEPDEGTLFLSNMGERFQINTLTKIVRDYVDAAGIRKPGSCHLWRHTAAVLMLENGADIRFVSELLGHSSIASSETYLRVSIEQLTRIHMLTHPGATMAFTPPQRFEGLRVSSAQVTTKAELLAAVDAEDDEDEAPESS